MASKVHKTLVLGVGNDIFADDNIGTKLCDFLKEEFKNKPIQFEKRSADGLNILEFISGYKTVIFIDTIKTASGQVGDVYLLTRDNFQDTLHLTNLRDTNLIHAFVQGDSHDLGIPEEMYIIAVEIKEDMIFSEYFTEELAIKYDEVKKKVTDYINQLIPDVINLKRSVKNEI